jgi:PAS domain S-box-containing protein
MKNNTLPSNNFEKELIDLHEKMVELEKLEIERVRTGKPYWKIEKEYRFFFEQAKEGMVIVQDGIIVRTNSPISQIVGYSSEELMGTPFNQYIHPDELWKVIENYNKRIAGKDAPIQYKITVKHKDGSDVDIEAKAGVITYHEKPADFAIISKI